MSFLTWLTSPRRATNGVRHTIQRLVMDADAKTDEQWEVVNQARLARGEPPITPQHPFRPRDLIDPREEERRE